MHSAPHALRSCLAILIAILGFLASMGHAAETFSPALLPSTFLQIVALRMR
jgi:hypothetical protein